MVETNQPTANLYVAVNCLVEEVGISVVKACQRVGINRNTYYKHKQKVERLGKKKAGAPDRATGTTHVETSTADHSQDTASRLSANN